MNQENIKQQETEASNIIEDLTLKEIEAKKIKGGTAIRILYKANVDF